MDALSFPFNGVTVPANPAHNMKGSTDVESVRRFGIYGYVIDTFEAPHAVKRALSAQTGMHDMLIGDESSIANKENIAQAGAHVWFTPQTNYSVKRSRYGNRQRTDVATPLRKSTNVFSAGQDQNAQEELNARKRALITKRNELTDRSDHLSADRQRVTQDISKIGLQIETLKRNRARMSKLQSLLSAREDRLAQISSALSQDDVESEKRKIVESTKSVENQVLEETLRLPELLKACTVALKAGDRAVLEFAKASVELSDLQDGMEDLNRSYQQLEARYNEAHSRFQEGMQRLKTLKREAESNCSEEQFKSIVSGLEYEGELNLDTVEDLIRSQKARADTMISASEDVVREYETRVKQIEILQRKVDTARESANLQRAELDGKRLGFITKLNTLIGRMSTKFSELYSFLGCSGEIVLRGAEESCSDLSELEIDIRVAYRKDAQLQSLNGMMQSGGERMVATMMYLFSLQELSCAPFRVVDEINQGMDADFERKILMLLIDHAAHEHNSQMFIITPKLLLDLEFNEYTTSHTILNGTVEAKKLAELVARTLLCNQNASKRIKI